MCCQLKLKKKSKYNLSDGEEDDFEIHDSGYFPERDDFEDEEPLDEDEAGQPVESESKCSLQICGSQLISFLHF